MDTCPFHYLTSPNSSKIWAPEFRIGSQTAVLEYISIKCCSRLLKYSSKNLYHFRFHIQNNNPQLLPHTVAVKRNAAAEPHLYGRPGLRASSLGTGLKSIVLTRCRKQREEIPERQLLSPLIWSHTASPCFCQHSCLIWTLHQLGLTIFSYRVLRT